jgi:hypothetical protein
MKLIKPSQISGEILTLFEEADEKVIIVSPYCKIGKWYKLLAKLKSLIERNVEIEFYVREGEFETIQEIEQVGIEPICIKNLHSKIYMNEKEAIVSSMNLLLSSEMNSLDIAYKTTTLEEYNELLDYYNRYIKRTEKENINFDKNYLFETLSNKFERIRIYENENELAFKTNNNNYSCFIWNTGKKNQNKLRISGILSGKEFESSKYLKNEIQKRTNLEIEFIEGGNRNGYGYDSVWATSFDFLETKNMNYIVPKELNLITENILNFITEIQNIKNNY